MSLSQALVSYMGHPYYKGGPCMKQVPVVPMCKPWSYFACFIQINPTLHKRYVHTAALENHYDIVSKTSHEHETW